MITLEERQERLVSGSFAQASSKNIPLDLIQSSVLTIPIHQPPILRRMYSLHLRQCSPCWSPVSLNLRTASIDCRYPMKQLSTGIHRPRSGERRYARLLRQWSHRRARRNWEESEPGEASCDEREKKNLSYFSCGLLNIPFEGQPIGLKVDTDRVCCRLTTDQCFLTKRQKTTFHR